VSQACQELSVDLGEHSSIQINHARLCLCVYVGNLVACACVISD
jgi:hypothetical protein